MKQTIYLEDGKIIESEFISEYKIPDDVIITNGVQHKVNFVGLIITKEYDIISVPKHFPLERCDEKNKFSIITTILKTIRKYSVGCNYLNKANGDFYENLPYRAVKNIIEYYNKFGVYRNDIKKEVFSIRGRVKWNKTFNKSNKIISGGNIVFVPFVTSVKENEYNLISEAMQYVVDYTKANLSFIFNVKNHFQIEYHKQKFKNLEKNINELQKMKSFVFKDIDISLIDSLIDFLKYISVSDSTYVMYNKNFESIWEEMIEQYLNRRFVMFCESEFIFSETKENGIKFKKVTKVIDDQIGAGRKIIELDHIAFDKDKVYLFDSKYYSNIADLNYKQVSYHYFVSELYGVDNINIINALVAPTEKDHCYSKCHINRIERDGVYIHELYIPIFIVMNSYIDS